MNGSIATLEAGLARRIDQLLSALHPEVRAASDELPRRLHPGTPAGQPWSSHFSPLVLLYPALQLEGLIELDSEAMLGLAVPHTLFFVHAFVEDHELDGQLEFSCAERLFTKWLFVSGLEQLRAAARDWSRVSRQIHQAYQACLDAQRGSFSAPPDATTTLDDWQSEIIVRRAGIPAAMAPICARDLGVADLEVAAIEAAARDVIVGLQWLDDLRDWRDDLATASQNLLLERVRRELGPGATERLDETATAAALTSLGLPRVALSRAAAHLRAGRDRQQSLGAERLAGMLAERVGLVERRLDAER